MVIEDKFGNKERGLKQQGYPGFQNCEAGYSYLYPSNNGNLGISDK